MGESNARSRSDKRALRERLLSARRARSPEERARTGAAIRSVLLRLPAPPLGGTIACYYSVGGEPDTRGLVEDLWREGSRVLLPIFRPDGPMDWADYEGPESLVPAGHGLLEPGGPRRGTEALGLADLVICPALAVDRRGMRLGRGAGWYDRALEYKRPDAPALALVHDEGLVESVPTEPHDRPMDAVVSPGAGLLRFTPLLPALATATGD
ncbi:5-formyltetrahydrofolate cyclo-ligase [Nocardiopsis alba]|uniref:5-formyltetrahydrofolate cyclo-ligase n=1 Tax=Nocardiopsis alba TaxID=53437 RepID=UPI00034C7EAE|nr:5-formyltetrahydrofolate cyclo-ligase [Nocardiopsis alba]